MDTTSFGGDGGFGVALIYVKMTFLHGELLALEVMEDLELHRFMRKRRFFMVN